ncbi:hypothetical protein GLOIN_2v1484018 [Rhizophagus irregularis DAOM 181602=DAOM 197198]|uniref:Uncharacterized protein n=1 Tax=Rhizophagus irregularis (strain DAOM 181602 / DAOM 197198 / MUCL 43194) TaxID=747089 RepID=A0A2P4PG30_RHIID|nr:hypothetical protein GLOIN_2v1484018 [Rhizophagus irregularis DAOM 181602=DAOM 197198]POG64307.1 hypothetical protein GLOIN_2v1484018 [Rhizophagus irregularis DAOM 181602=DAOM 197198]|eukprot:XP_025171173.1 hypothetical protein GLOIN_2v1484018 [Rhizophagus irregularis DAOM 181602=DAOM 197198]
MSLDELSQYAPELLSLLPDKVKRDQACQRLQNGYGFSREQASVLVSILRAGQSKGGATSNSFLRIVQDNLSKAEVKVAAKSLAETAPNADVGTSHLSRLRSELRSLSISEKIISATLNPDITCSANKIQKEKCLLRENEGINYPDHFALESVNKRLLSTCRCDGNALYSPAKIKDLCISNGGVTGYAKNQGQQDIPRVFRSLEKNEKRARQLLTWIQEAIVSRVLKDPGKLGAQWFNTFLKNYNLLPSYLRKIGVVFAVEEHDAKILSKAMTIASEALRHSSDNNTSSVQNYIIVNYRPRGVPYDQAIPFKVSDKN